MQTYSILKKFQAASFKIFLHSVCLGVSFRQPVTYVTIGLLNLEKKRLQSVSYRKNALNHLII